MSVNIKFCNPTASFFIPDGKTAEAAFQRTTHLGIGAHQDDLEIMAFHGILQCFADPDQWFGGVICTDGSGSVRTGKYASISDEELVRIRKKEQQAAASLGKYSFVIQLDYPSESIKNPDEKQLEEELFSLLAVIKPSVVYTHNPADKHETHIGTVMAVIHAARKLPMEQRPKTIYGCEAWRDLDWMSDDDKIALDVSDKDHLGKRLIDIFQSQIAGGKRYDLATTGRWHANATYFNPYETDKASQLMYAMDLSPLAADDSLDIVDYVTAHIRRFQQDVETKLKRIGGLGPRA
jgi:LmbE family N-acetylglucosaminyl deacetylase